MKQQEKIHGVACAQSPSNAARRHLSQSSQSYKVLCELQEHPSVSSYLNRESLHCGRIFVISFFLFHENSNFCSSQVKMIRGWDACQMLSSWNDSKLQHTGKKVYEMWYDRVSKRDGILTVPKSPVLVWLTAKLEISASQMMDRNSRMN